MTSASIINTGEVAFTPARTAGNNGKAYSKTDFAASLAEAGENTAALNGNRSYEFEKREEKSYEFENADVGKNDVRKKVSTVRSTEKNRLAKDKVMSGCKEPNENDEDLTVSDEKKENDGTGYTDLIAEILNIMKLITNLCNVTAGDLKTGMENLNIQPETLLKTDMVAQLVMELKQVTEADIIADEAVSSLISDLKLGIEEITKNIDFESLKLDQVTDNAIESISESDFIDLGTTLYLTEDEESTFLQTLKELYSLSGGSEKLEAAFVNPVTEQMNDEIPLMVQHKESLMEGNDSQMTANQQFLSESDNGSVNLTDSGWKHSGDKSNENRKGAGESHYNEFIIEGNQVQLNETGEPAEVFLDNRSGIASFSDTTRDIANQMLSFIKITVKPGITEAQMNLHPESLGNIHVKIESGENGMTARFITQNEQVKAAIETQVTVLKESLEAQGIKVEAVEVAVASHQFEQSNERETDKSNNEKGHSSRKIHLDANDSDDTEVDTEVSEEDRIVKEMLRANGNTVDYKA